MDLYNSLWKLMFRDFYFKSLENALYHISENKETIIIIV